MLKTFVCSTQMYAKTILDFIFSSLNVPAILFKISLSFIIS